MDSLLSFPGGLFHPPIFGSPGLHHFWETIAIAFTTGVAREKLPVSTVTCPDIDNKGVAAAIFPANDCLASIGPTHGREIACLARVAPRH
jgi:hypothetical protein